MAFRFLCLFFVPSSTENTPFLARDLAQHHHSDFVRRIPPHIVYFPSWRNFIFGAIALWLFCR